MCQSNHRRGSSSQSCSSVGLQTRDCFEGFGLLNHVEKKKIKLKMTTVVAL